MQIVQEQECTWKKQDHGLVFAPSISLCMQLACSSGWHYYVEHKETMNEENWAREYHAWREGRDNRVMIVTSAFSTGNDYPHMHLVLHVDKPFNMVRYVQAQGWAGHDSAICSHHIALEDQAARSWECWQTASMPCMSMYSCTVSSDASNMTWHCLQMAWAWPISNFPTTSCAVCATWTCTTSQRTSWLLACQSQGSLHPGPLSHPFQTLSIPYFPCLPHDSPFIQVTIKPKQMTSSHQLKNSAKADVMLVVLHGLEDICTMCKILDPESNKQMHHLYCCPCLMSHANSSWDKYKEWRKGLCYVKWDNKICWLCHVP